MYISPIGYGHASKASIENTGGFDTTQQRFSSDRYPAPIATLENASLNLNQYSPIESMTSKSAPREPVEIRSSTVNMMTPRIQGFSQIVRNRNVFDKNNQPIQG